MPISTVNGVEIYHRCEGAGEPVLLIMGLAVTHEGWELQRESLSRTHTVCVFDNRGVGRSGVPAPPYSVADMAEDALGLMDVLGWETAHIVGLSMGGMIAQRLALLAPERVRSLALLATHAGGWSSRPTVAAVVGIARSFLMGSPRQKEDNLLRMLHSRKYLDASGEAYAREKLQEKLVGANPPRRAVLGQAAAALRHGCLDELPALRGRIPALVLTGTGDRVVRPENSRLIAEALDAELLLFEDYGHAIQVEQAEAINAALRRLFDAADGVSGARQRGAG